MKKNLYSLSNQIAKVGLCTFLLASLSAMDAKAQQTIEAENFTNSLYAAANSNGNFSGGGFLSMRGAYGSYAQYSVTVDAAGTYDITFAYTTMDLRKLSVKVNNQVYQPLTFDDFIEYDGQDGTKEKTTQIYLEAGANIIELGGYKTWSPNIDKFVIEKSATEIAKPKEQIAPIVLEAEDADVKLGTQGSDSNFLNFSGGKGIGGTSNNGFKIQYLEVNVPEAGAYDVAVFYASTEKRYVYVQVDGKKRSIIEFKDNTSGWGNDPHNDEATPAVFKQVGSVYMNAGNNKLTLGAHNGWSPNLDKIEIIKSGENTTDPGIEINAFSFDYTDIATLSESTLTTVANLAKLNDNNEHTVYVGAAPQVKITAELPYPIILTGYAYAANVEEPSSNGWLVEYSLDGSNWIFMTTTASNNNNNYWTYTTSLKPGDSDPTAAKYYRLTATGTSNVEIGDWQLFGVPYVSKAQNFPDDLIEMVDGNYTGTLTASHEGFNESGFVEIYKNVLDKKVTTKYTATGTSSLWLDYEFIGSEIVKSYSLSVPYTDNYRGRNPKSWILSGFTVNEEWVELDVQKGRVFPVTGSTLIFNVKNPEECYAYKLEIKETASSNECHLMAWQLFGEAINDPTAVGIEKEATNNVSITAFGGEDKVTIITDLVNAKYSIYDLIGKVLKNGSCNDTTTEIGMLKGFYIVKVNNTSVKVFVK